MIPLVGRERWEREVGVRALTGIESPRAKQRLEGKHRFRLPTCTGGKDSEGVGGGSASRAFYAGQRTGRGHSRTLPKDELDVFFIAALYIFAQ